MNLTPRLYSGPEDLRQMDAILSAGINSGICAHYVHPGDLRWWLYYTFPEESPWPNLYLWEDDHHRAAAWTLFSPAESAVDLFYLPELHDTSEMRGMLAWSVEQMTAIQSRLGADVVYKHWVRTEDAVLQGALESLGFRQSEDSAVHMVYRLDGALPAPALPPGFDVRGCHGLGELEKRAAVQHGAFESDLPMGRYLERFRNYMSSPAYISEQDIVIEAPDGRLAAFARIWPDAATRVGNFEPVGVHPEFQRRGLGREVMLEGLRRLLRLGMTAAQVGTGSSNLPAVRLYEAVGFRVEWIALIYEKDIAVSG